MKRFIILAIVTVVLSACSAGCVMVPPPDGPVNGPVMGHPHWGGGPPSDPGQPHF